MLPSLDDVVRSRPGASVPDIVRDMRRGGARRIVLKRGAEGVRIYRPDASPIDIPALPDATVADLTGAGDAFCGGFLAGMHRTGDLVEAGLHGTVSASFAIETPGFAGLLEARPEQARERLERLRAGFHP